MKTKLLTLAILLNLVFGITNASHVVGIRITYEYTSSGYLFKLKMYRDCWGIAAPSSVNICFNSPSGCAPPMSVTLAMDVLNSGFEVPFNSCAGVGTTNCNGGNVFAFEEYNYMGYVTVPPCSDWVIAYSLCCRNAAITNLVDPDTYNGRVVTRMDNLNYPTNSSPQFNAVPVNYYCAGMPAVIDYSAYDVDGDSLSYEFTAIDGGSCGASQIIPFAPGFTYDQPLATLVPTMFDPVSGQISFTPSSLQISVIGFRVNEYRNGVLIGSVSRDDEVVVVGNFVNPDTIAGRVYYDLNTNGIFDLGDIGATGTIVHMGPGNSYTTASSSGKYELQASAGMFSVSLPNPPLYTTITPPIHIVNTPGNGVHFGNRDFILEPVPNMDDLEITVNNMGVPIPGMNYPVVMNYRNAGTTTQSNVDIVLTLDPKLQYLSSVPVPTSVAGNTISWNIPALNMFSSGIITVQTSVDTLSLAGDPVTCSVSITSSANELTPNNNYDSFTDIVLASFDPNTKEVTPTGDLPISFITSQQWLNYKINFQNLGTAPAQTVRIIDLLDYDLDLSSIELVASSKPCAMSLSSPNRLEFHFFGINLPPASTNEPGSHGFVEFRIKPKSTVAVNNYITNNAHIIFDFNAPIYTNLVANKVVTITGIGQGHANQFQIPVYPNPADNFINVEVLSSSDEIAVINLINILGETIYDEKHSLTPGTNNIKIEVMNYSPGMYFLRISKSNGSGITKILVN